MVKVEIRYLNPESPPPSYTTLDVSSGVLAWDVSDMNLFDESLFIQEPQTASITLSGNIQLQEVLMGHLQNDQEIITKTIHESVYDYEGTVPRPEETNITKARLIISTTGDDGSTLFRGFIERDSIKYNYKENTYTISAIDPLYLYKLALEDAKINVSMNTVAGSYLTAQQLLKIMGWAYDSDTDTVTDNTVEMSEEDARSLLYETDEIGGIDTILVDVDDIKKNVNVTSPTTVASFGFPVIQDVLVSEWNSVNILSGAKDVHKPLRCDPIEFPSVSNAINWLPNIDGDYSPDDIIISTIEFRDLSGLRIENGKAVFRYYRQFRFIFRALEGWTDTPDYRWYRAHVTFIRKIIYDSGMIHKDTTERVAFIEYVPPAWETNQSPPTIPDNLAFSTPLTMTESVTLNGNTYSLNITESYLGVVNPTLPLVQMNLKYEGLLAIHEYNFGEENILPALDLLKLVCYTNNLRCYFDKLSNAVKFQPRTNYRASLASPNYTIADNSNIIDRENSKLFFSYHDSRAILDDLYFSDYNLQRLYNNIYESILRNDTNVIEITLHQREGSLFNRGNIGDLISYDSKNWIIMSVAITGDKTKQITLWEARTDEV